MAEFGDQMKRINGRDDRDTSFVPGLGHSRPFTQPVSYAGLAKQHHSLSDNKVDTTQPSDESNEEQ
jgi:hypothetical protein